jgi:hypothetical protein
MVEVQSAASGVALLAASLSLPTVALAQERWGGGISLLF